MLGDTGIECGFGASLKRGTSRMRAAEFVPHCHDALGRLEFMRVPTPVWSSRGRGCLN